MSQWKELSIEQLQCNPFTMIGKEWMLVTAGDETAHNTLTASWGGMGVLWKKNVVFTFIRPQRYTLPFLQAQDCYSLSFFDESYRKVLAYCGSHSGREVDKDKETGLTVAFADGVPYYEEAKLVILCKKMAEQPLDPACFLQSSIDGEIYPDKDYHQMFIASIEKILVKD